MCNCIDTQLILNAAGGIPKFSYRKMYSCVLLFLPWDAVSHNEDCFLFTNSFQRKNWAGFFPQVSRNNSFFCFFPPINDSIMIFSKSSVVSYSCLFFQESLSQMKIAGLWEKTMSLIWILNGSVHRRHLKDVFWDKLICLASLSNDFRINTSLRTVLKVFER